VIASTISGEIKDRVRTALRHDLHIGDLAIQAIPDGAQAVNEYLDELISIARRTTAKRVEPYLAQLLDDVCVHCAYQSNSGYCNLRQSQACTLFSSAERIFRSISRALESAGDEEYLRCHASPNALPVLRSDGLPCQRRPDISKNSCARCKTCRALA
jgi:hypothetical protein